MTQHEVETKLTVSKEDFESLIHQHGDLQDCVNQLNVYFDQDHQLSRNASTFRIRLFGENRHPVMTLKVPIRAERNDLDETRRALEVEKELDRHATEHPPRDLDIARDLPSEFQGVLSEFEVSCLERLGSMRTWRHLVRLADDLVVEADRVRLPGGQEFYEVEFESDSPERHQAALDMIRDLAPSSSPSECSKYERFVGSLGDKQGDGHFTENDTTMHIEPNA